MKAQTALPDGFNLLSPDTFLSGHPLTAYDELRIANPVHYHPGDNDMEPFWVLTRHQDIREVSFDSERFTTTEGFNVTTAGRLGSSSGIVEAIGRNILGYDRPDHTEFRRALMPAFSSKKIAVMEARTSAYVTELLDGLEGRSEIDFVSELAELVPIRVLCNVLGIPPEDESKILSWTNRMVGAQDPEFAPDPAMAFEAYMEVFAYGKWLVEQRRQDPRDDLMSLLANADFDGVPGLRRRYSSLPWRSAGTDGDTHSIAGLAVALPQYRNHAATNLSAQ